MDGVPVVLIRHAEHERVPRDGPLTERGTRQARDTAAALDLAPDDVVVSSPAMRTRQTALAFGRAFWVVEELSGLRTGPDWDWSQAHLWQPDDSAGAETLAQFQTRIDAALNRLVERRTAGRLVLCVHTAVIDAALRWAFGISPRDPLTTETVVPHCAITELRHWPSGRHPLGAPRHTVLLRVGDVSHLAAQLRGPSR
jgi:broad specificity phosphatase PhoE